eukprot:680188-Pelagomonas_calceolata.AAC.1
MPFYAERLDPPQVIGAAPNRKGTVRVQAKEGGVVPSAIHAPSTGNALMMVAKMAVERFIILEEALATHA